MLFSFCCLITADYKSQNILSLPLLSDFLPALSFTYGARFICQMNCPRGVLQILEIVSQCINVEWEMTSLYDFHTRVLGCSHKRDRWAVKMGLVTVCSRKKGRDVYQPLCSYTLSHTHSRTWVVQLCSVYHVWRKKVNKWHKVRERKRERQFSVLKWHFNGSKRQRGMEGGIRTRREDIFLSK